MKEIDMVKTVSPVGQSFDDFLKEEGMADAVAVEAQLRVLAWRIEQQRKAIGLTKAALAKAMDTSRSQLDRILHAEKATLTVEVLDRAARAVGLRLKLDLEPVAG
ncbi:MAG: helix-turn-helix domain-containing protein [Ferrovibrio sp.]|uniref:helix-turn-helix domain-containing protein n=1 Tax=Ferrovibrio sp. TaxID=1917215 RepID=UPI0026081957|nr:helix-turn-helix transcriptional regulator [Ferrovibrio sp.]MCW0236664.1 helix-turn-helix domain-containing protein [Ferrovibrio sp.]